MDHIYINIFDAGLFAGNAAGQLGRCPESFQFPNFMAILILSIKRLPDRLEISQRGKQDKNAEEQTAIKEENTKQRNKDQTTQTR